MKTALLAVGRYPGERADVPAQAEVQALIAEARARARRRRRRIALGAIAGIAAAIAVLVVVTWPGPARVVTSARPRAVGTAARTGVVTGHLAACVGPIPLPGQPLPVTPGTVTVVRGQAKWVMRPVRPGEWQQVLVVPAGRLAAEHISNNYHQIFRFVLPPGRYVLVGRFDVGHGATGFAEVTVVAGKTVRADVPNMCI